MERGYHVKWRDVVEVPPTKNHFLRHCELLMHSSGLLGRAHTALLIRGFLGPPQDPTNIFAVVAVLGACSAKKVGSLESARV